MMVLPLLSSYYSPLMSSFLSMATMFPGRVVDPMEMPRWILLTTCVVGVVLAYVTDEGYSLLVDDEGVSVSNSVLTAVKTTNGNTVGLLPYAAATVASVMREWANASGLALRANLPEAIAALVARLKDVMRSRLAQFELLKAGIRLKRQAKTKRQFLYLMEKTVLKLPIRPEETEIDSYLDCKEKLVPRWPFTWEVSRVRDVKIGCDGYECIPMSSYSYLDFIRDARVQDSAIRSAQEWSSGNHGPRMLGGNTKILRDLERVVAQFFSREDTLLCATGFLACMSACAAVSSESTVIFADTRLHASLSTGLKIGDGKVVQFRHNNFEDCETKIKRFRHRYPDAWIIIESVYSMDGDICDLPAANALCQKYNIKLMIDEAHGLGVLGSTGRGVEEHFDLRGCATVLVGTFSKSIASIGGYITGPKRFISYLDFHAIGNVFSAPLPAYSAGAAMKSFKLIDEEPQHVTRVKAMSQLLRKKLTTGGHYWPPSYPEFKKYIVDGHPASAVLPVVFPDDIDRVMRIAISLKKKGYMCSAVGYPACSLRRPRFRITATAAYTAELIDNFVRTLVETCVEEGPSDFKLLLNL